MSLKSTSIFGTSIWMYPPDLKSRFSPSGNLTTNSLINVATFLFETTSHSHFCIPITSLGTYILMLSFTLIWQPKRQLSCISFRVKNPVSVGRMVPAPDSTWHLHMPHVPPPPQAEGKNNSFSLKVESKVLPGWVSISFSPS